MNILNAQQNCMKSIRKPNDRDRRIMSFDNKNSIIESEQKEMFDNNINILTILSNVLKLSW